MGLKVYARHGGAVAASQDDITARIPFLDGVEGTPIVQMGMSVQNGGASQGTTLVPDPTANDDASLYFPPHTQITLTSDATGDELMLAQGRISGYEIGRAPGSEIEDAVEWSLTIDDANVDLRGLAFTEAWVRPAETGMERLYALALYTLSGTSSTRPDFATKITYRPSTTIIIDSSHLAPNTNTLVMPAKTYPAGTQPQDVCNDVATTEGKVYGVVPHHSGGVSHLCLLVIKESDHSTYASTVKISDQLADWDPDDLTAPVFEPIWDQGKGQVVDGNANISGLVSRYGSDDKVVISVDETLGDDNEYWVDAYQDGDSVDSAQATNRAASIIAYRSPFQETDRCSIEMAPEQHHLITAGMSIQAKTATVAAGTVSTLGSYVDRRIVSLSWEPRSNGKLHAILELNRPTRTGGVGRAQPAATTPTGAPNCEDTGPFAVGLGVDGAGWTKQNDPESPPNPSIPTYQADSVAASGDNALFTNTFDANRNFGVGPPAGFHDWYTGGKVTKASYSPATCEEMLFRFNIAVLGDGIADYTPSIWFITGATNTRGARLYLPNAALGVPHNGLVEALGGGTPTAFTLTSGQSYYLRWKAGAVYVWEVGDTEPGSPTATGGGSSGTGGLAMALDPAYDDPSAVEVESLTIFQAINDPFCLTDPGASPYFAKSDDPRFDTIVTDHGALSGLGDDDHAQYIKDAEFTAKGDILAGTGSGTFDNLPVGTNGKVLKANSAMSTGLEWATETGGGSGPFEDVDTFAWKFTSPANEIRSNDESSGLQLDANLAQLTGYSGQALIIQDGKLFTYSDFGLVIPAFTGGDPAGGDSEVGQVYYDLDNDKFRAYENGSWVDMIGGGGSSLASQNQAATADYTLTTSDADVTGATITISPSVAETWLVWATGDFDVTTASTSIGVLTVMYDGSAQTGGIFVKQVSTVARITTSSVWVIPGVTAASHTIKLRALKTASGGAITLKQDHTKITVLRFS